MINRLDNYFLSPLILPILSTLLFPRDCLFHDTGTYRRSEWRLSRSTSSLLRLRACVIVYPAWYVDLVFSFYHTILSSSRVKIRRLFVEGRVRGGGERRKKNCYHFCKRTVSTESRERTLCLRPVVLHLYISDWSRVVPLPPPYREPSFSSPSSLREEYIHFYDIYLALYVSLSFTLSLSLFLVVSQISFPFSLYSSRWKCHPKT